MGAATRVGIGSCLLGNAVRHNGGHKLEVRAGSGAGPSAEGVGIFARAFLERFPPLPVEDEAGLADPETRERFVERLFACPRRERG